jgi:hypothetical protein
MNCVESSDQDKYMLKKETNEAKEPYVFKYDILCVFVGSKESEGRKIKDLS